MPPRFMSQSEAPAGAGADEGVLTEAEQSESDLVDLALADKDGTALPTPSRKPRRSPCEGWSPNFRVGTEAVLEAHAGNWAPLDARVAAAARGEATLTHAEVVMLARRQERHASGKLGRPTGRSWQTVARHVAISQHLARLRRQGLRRPDAIAATEDFFRRKFNVTRATVLAAEPLFKSYARDEHRIAEIDAEALVRGEVPDVSTRRGKRPEETEADHLAALQRMMRNHRG